MSDLAAPPVLSTPAEHLFDVLEPKAPTSRQSTRSDDELRSIYEIDRTARELREGGWKRVALQFPDHMLKDAPGVVGALNDALKADAAGGDAHEPTESSSETANARGAVPRLYVLADTSYSACCVDEIAAEHVNAQVVVHYGRSCLSPTARLPVIYIFTRYPLDHASVIQDVEYAFPEKETNLVVMADVTYQDHVPAICSALRDGGYRNVLSTAVVHDPSAPVPNRKLISGAETETEADLTTYSAIHISTPPTSLLLALNSRLRNFHIHPTPNTDSPDADPDPNTAALLRRRFARVLSLASAGTVGILVNTLSVANYLSTIQALRKQIDAAGKKSYTVVVGKLNPAKLANFAEVEGWVVVGCWESGLVEDDREYYRPVVTPFELGVALMREEERVWGGEWWGGIEGLKMGVETETEAGEKKAGNGDIAVAELVEALDEVEGGVEGEESTPPEFDLRTGKLVSHSRPMRAARAQSSTEAANGESSTPASSAALIKRGEAGQLATINGVVSPGAEFLRSQRTWQGLGTEFTPEESTVVEEGRRGVARGYVVGDELSRT